MGVPKDFKPRKYDVEFKEESVALFIRSSKQITQFAEDIGVPTRTFRGWLYKYQNKTPENEVTLEQVFELKKELADVKLERDILKKAMAIFSRNQ